MAPQVVNMELLLSPQLAPGQLATMEVLVDPHVTRPIVNNAKSERSRDSDNSNYSKRRSRRKHSARSVIPNQDDPFNMIKSLFFSGGSSKAYCNEETLSSSFLILDGFMTISLGDAKSEFVGFSIDDATERWGKRLETNICVGKVSYEYRLSDEAEKSMKSMSHSFSEDGDEESTTKASILSQNLEKIPLVLDEEPIEDGTMLDPDRYLPPSHKMVADALKVRTL